MSSVWFTRARRARRLLAAEAALICEADLAGLAAQAPRTRAACEAWEATRPSDLEDDEARASIVEEIDAIRAAADRNRRLLAALLTGAAEARSMVEAHSLAVKRLGYTRSGTALTQGAKARRDERA